MERAVESSNLAYLEALYHDYQSNPAALGSEWHSYFAALSTPAELHSGAAQTLPASLADFILKVERLVRSYRERGHLAAQLDPLGRVRPRPADLEPAFHGLSEADLAVPLPPGLFGSSANLSQLLEQLRTTYCGSVGIEIGHLDNPRVRYWLESRFEAGLARPTAEQQQQILDRLLQASLWEEFLARKYLGAKTFSAEGIEAFVPLLDIALGQAARQGASEAVMAMAHRGRLNVLANVVRKPYEDIFLEFEEWFPEGYSGDVKYHLGYSNDIETPHGKLHLSLNFNPSHLEFAPVVAMGRLRAKQDRFGDHERRKGLLVAIHGDAAFIGEGIVQETLNIGGLSSYTVGGALHIILNNQVGFTTEPGEYTAGRYSTEIAKMLESPIFHVNAEDPDAVFGVALMAMEFRATFGRDVFIDLVGYRRKGHNETDEPGFTQPQMYALIAERPQAYRSYFKTLQARGVVSQADLDRMIAAYSDTLEEAFNQAKREPHPVRPPAGGGVWKGYQGGLEQLVPEEVTGLPADRLGQLMQTVHSFPPDFTLHPKLVRFVEGRREMGQGQRPLDWAAAESLALASLAAEGHRVRMSGQDVIRGTFTQRHAGFTDYQTGQRYLGLQHLVEGQAPVELYNSALSEAGVLGFEYGYSLDAPEALVLWEAQFGDFVNTAQVIIDQFIASAEAKWSRLSGLVLLLPHGLEGQGPEHSSARLERFLQLCANDNLQVTYPSTPAQYFHLLRRQVKRPYRKPLVVMTPKSLLRNPEAVSPLADLTEGTFRRVLPDPMVDPQAVTRILLCSGKIYYDLVARRHETGRMDVAIVRLEQFYPFSDRELMEALAPYPSEIPLVWVQEEASNQGAWWFLRARFGFLAHGHPFMGIARPESSSPAVGSSKVHKREQAEVIDQAFQ
jgi:2-oxoglutarate dehydrogenase E1 component